MPRSNRIYLMMSQNDVQRGNQKPVQFRDVPLDAVSCPCSDSRRIVFKDCSAGVVPFHDVPLRMLAGFGEPIGVGFFSVKGKG